MQDNNKAKVGSGEVRYGIIIKTSIIGIVANLILASLKGIIGVFTNSIAVILDAVNNLSDALSSVITIIGTKAASRKPDKKHPLGYGRVEYLSAILVAAIVLYAGITSLTEAVKKIFDPEAADYSTTSLIIIGAAVVVKLLLGMYVKKTGKRVNSGSLIASGSEALFDAIISVSVLVSAIIYMMCNVSLEAYVGAIISLLIIKSGIEMMRDTLDEILGKRIDGDYLKEIKQTICQDENVLGAFDLILHSYGPDKYIGSVHVEIMDTMTVEEIDTMERRIAGNVYEKHGVLLGGVGIYSVNTKNDEVKNLRTEINHLVMSYDGVLQIHGFFADMENKAISFDIILNYSLDNREELFDKIHKKLTEKYPDYVLNVTMDIDI